jgi:chemotaxis response regulator CheB
LFQSSGSAASPPDANVDSAASTQDSGIGGAEALLAKIRLIGRLIRPEEALPDKEDSATSGARSSVLGNQPSTLIAIGASAGGPAALARVLATFPANFPAPIVVVQHVDAQFASGLADWLGNQTPLKVRLAQEGDRPQAGSVLLAGPQGAALKPQDTGRTPDTTHFLLRNPETLHLTLASGGFLTYTRFPLDCSYRPSIDVFFHSIQRLWPGNCLAAILSGMGRDGAEGLKALKDAGHYTIAQDEASSAVYGMPKAAVELDAASEILPLNQIGPRIAAFVAGKK